MAQLTPKQAALKIGIAEATLSDWRQQGKGPIYTKTGHLIRYPEDGVDTWISQRTFDPATKAPIRKGSVTEEREMVRKVQAQGKIRSSLDRFAGHTGKRPGRAISS